MRTTTNPTRTSRVRAVHASWTCSLAPGWGFGVQSCTATTASGGAVDTKPGKHAFTVRGIAQNASEPIAVTVRYTVR